MASRDFIGLEELEPRVLLSADGLSAGQDFEASSLPETVLVGSFEQASPSDLEALNPDLAVESVGEGIDAIFEGEGLFAGAEDLDLPGPEGADEALTVQPGEVLMGNGNFPAIVNHGTVSPGESPGIQNVPSFNQGADGVLLIELAGTGGAGAANGHDKVVVAGAATLNGTLDIDLINGFVPSAGQTFEVMSWGSRTGEIDNWLGTVNIPGQPGLALVPVYNANNLTLQVVATPSVTGAETALNNGLTTLSNLANLLDSLGSFAEAIPLIGDNLGNIVDMGSAVNNAIRAQIASILAALPPQSGVTAAIENWDGDNVAGFNISVLGVLGHYGTVGVNPFWWDVKLELTPAAVNRVVQEVAGAVLGAVFDPNPTVSVQGSLILDFSFGHDPPAGGFFVDIDEMTAKASVSVSGISGFEFDLLPPGGPLSLDVVNGTFDLEASVTATPDASVQDANGRIRQATLTGLVGGSPALSDAFNLDEAGTVDASLTLDGALTGFGVTYSGTHTVEIQDSDLFDETDPDLMVKIDGEMGLLGQTLEGIFIFKKTATETIVEASGVRLELTAGAGVAERRILLAENGAGKFLVLDDELAGSATLTLTQGPTIPNIDISGTTLNLTLNTSTGAVATIDGVEVNLPAGPYYKVAGHAVIALTVPDAEIEGDFVFEPFDPTPGVPDSGDEVVNVGVAGLAFDFNLGTADLLTVTNGTGAMVFKSTGMAAEITSADVALDLPGVDLIGTFAIEVNDTNAAHNSTVDVNGTPVVVNVPAGPYVRVAASNAELEVLGIELRGNFAFEEKTTTTGGEEIITVAASGVSLDLGSAASDLVNITNGSGTFIITDAGVAGLGSVTLSLGVPSVGISGTFSLTLNTTEAAVNETVSIGGSPVVVNVPVGPYLRLFGNDINLALFGLTITGDYTFEQKNAVDGTQIVTIEAAEVRFDLGTEVIELTNGEALFVLVDSGLAGRGRIDVEISALGGTFAQPFTWEFNNTTQAIDELIPNDAESMGGAALTAQAVDDVIEALDLPAGPYNRISTEGPVSFSVVAGGQTQSISGELVITLVDAAPDYATVGVSNFDMTLAAGPVSLTVADGTGALVINAAGVAGKVTAGTVTLGGAPAGLGVTASNLEVQFNTTGADIDVAVVVSENPDVTVEVEYSGTYYHDFLAISGAAEITAGTFVTLGGNFQIEVSEAAPNTLKIYGTDLHFDLKAGALTILSFHNGAAGFVISNAGLAGSGTIQFESGLIGVSGSISFEINTGAAAVNTTFATPTGTKTVNLTSVNYFRIAVNGSLLLGSVSLPFNFVVQQVAGTTEFREAGSNTLLVSISPTGAITTGLSFDDFAAPGPFEWVSMLQQLGNWIGVLREAEMFDIEIPFTQGVTLGEAFDWSQLFLDQIYSEMLSVELPSTSLRGIGPFTGTLVNAKLKLKLGTEAAVEVTVNGSYGVNGAVHDLDELAALFNAGLTAAGLGARVEAKRNKDDQFVIALKKAEIAAGTQLCITDLDDVIEGLGFGPNDGTYGDAADATVDQTGLQAARYNTDDFFEALGALLGPTVNYDPAQRVYSYTVNIGDTYELLDLPLNFDLDLGPVGEASLNGQLKVTASVGFQFTLGFDLGAREVPILLSSPLVPVPAHGRISADANFKIYLNDAITPINLTLPAAVTTANSNVDQLATDLNDLFAATIYNGNPLSQVLVAQKAGTGLAIKAQPAQLGLVNRIIIDAAINDTFATEMGFGAEVIDLDGSGATTADQFFRTTATSDVKGLFLEDAGFAASLSVTTTTPISGSLRFGFVEISTTGGVVGTQDLDGNPQPIIASITLQNPDDGEGRFYISDLFSGLSTANIGQMIDGPDLSGAVLLRLDNISVSGLGFSLPLGSNPEICVFIPDITDLEFNPDPYDGTNTGIFLKYPDLGSLENFESLSFTQIIKALQAIADSLSQLSAFSFLNERLPFVNMSINDMVDYAVKFAELIDGAAAGGAETLQETIEELETQIEDLFNLDPDILNVSLDTNGLAASPFLAGGVDGSSHATFNFNPTGSHNGIRFSTVNLAAAAGLNGTKIRVVGNGSLAEGTAQASYNPSFNPKEFTITIGHRATADAIIAAVNGLSGSPINASLIAADGAPNNGDGVIFTNALRFQFEFLSAYAETLPFEVDLKELLSSVAGDNSAASAFLEAATTLIQVSGSGELTVSASAKLTLDFGLDLTTPGTVKPFFYDETGVELTAKVLGTNLEIEASLGSVVGIFIKEGEITLDADGDPETDAGDGDKGARFRLGLEDNNGDGRHYFNENWFDEESIDLTLEGGVSARLPIFAPFESTPLDGEGDENGDNVPDNQLFINIPDLVRLFIADKADGNTAVVVFGGANNDLNIVSTTHNDYEIELVNDPDAPEGASFSGNKLTLIFNSGITTANQLVDRINDLATFGGSTRTATDNGAANNGNGFINKITIVTPDFSALFADLDLCALLDSQAGNLLDGLDAFLGSVQDGLNEIVFSTQLPLIGDGLAGAANFIEDFRNGLLQELRDALDAAGGSATTAIENALKKAFWDVLGPDGLDLLVNFETGDPLDAALGYGQLDVVLDCDNGLVVNLRLGKTAALVDTSENPIDFEIGVPGFGLAVSGNVVVEIGFDLKFGFGLNKEDGFYFNSSAPASDPELRIYFEASIPGLSASGELFFLQLDISDDPDAPSFFTGQFVVDLKDPNSDGKLTFSEMTSSGTEFEDIIGANLEAIADVNLDLAASFGGNTAFPRVVGEFHLDWSWDLQDGATDPEIAFTNIALDLGTFLSDFLGPILKEIRKVTEPLDPIIDIVTTPLPVLSDLAGEPITLLDLAEIFGLLEPSTVDFIESIIQVIDLINSLEGIGEGTILIPFGSFNLTADESGQMTNIAPLQNLGSIDLGAAIASASGPGVSSTYQSTTSGFASDVGSLDNFSIPIFDNPTELFNLFVGEPVRLIEWRMPTFKFEFTYIQKIPIYPPLYAQFGGSIGATIDIGFGYDTFGIQKFIESEDKNVLDLFDGFYVLDFDANGNERPELSLTGEIFAGASIDLFIVEAGVRGGITATIDFDLNDVVDDGKVRVSEIVANALQDPRCIFDINGRLGLFLEAFLYIDLFFFSIDKEWRFADITLFEFSITCPEPVLAELSGDTLKLNIGTRASERKEIDTTDNSETFKVTHISGDATSGETVEVQWGDWKKEFSGVKKVVVEDAGQGDDYIDTRGVLSPVEIQGGVGNDTIFLSEGTGSKAWGGDNNDTITAAGGASTVIYGDNGNDILLANMLAIEIHGGEGNDTITGSPQADNLFGDGGADTINSGDGNDVVDAGAGNDTVDAGAGIDTILGGAGADVLRGNRDDDLINGGDDADQIYGGAGNDFLVGGTGNDKIYGHGGIDLIIGDSYSTVKGVALTAANISATLAAIETGGVSVQGLTGEGDDFLIGGGNYDVIFGGDGDDFLYGGNFFESGSTEVIEEDDNDFFDGGTGDDEIFGDDALGKAGDRDTGIAIKSSIWFDLIPDGLRDENELGFAGITVELRKQSDDTLIGSFLTKADGLFEFVGLDPNNYYLKFLIPGGSGLAFTNKWAGGATSPTGADDDSDVRTAQTRTDQFFLDFNTTLDSVTAGFTGPSKVSINDISVNEGSSGQAQATFTVALSGPQLAPVEIDYAAVNGTATLASGDYQSASGMLVFNPGEVLKTITVFVNGDTMYEEHEQFELDITRAQRMDAVPFNLQVTDSQVLATIINDDQVPQISIGDYVPVLVDHDSDINTPLLGDEDQDARFIVTLTNPSQFTIKVRYRVDTALDFQGLEIDNAARPFPLFPVNEADFKLGSGVLTFAPGVTRQVITVETIEDTLDEHDEAFFVDLFSPEFAKIADSRGYGIIPDDDQEVSVKIVPVTPVGGPFRTEVAEGNSDTVPVSFEVRLSKESGKRIQVTWATSPGTAVEAVPTTSANWIDYIAEPNSTTAEAIKTLIFEPGETVKTITVEVVADNQDEADEMFFVNILSSDEADIARGAPLESNHATVVIKDDDGPVAVDNGPWSIYFGETSYTVAEPDSSIVYLNVTVKRTPGSSHPVAVLYTQNGSATAPGDYNAIFREIVQFNGNETSKTVQIAIKADALTEGAETFHLYLKNPTGGPVNAEPDHIVVTITDEDLPSAVIYPPILTIFPTLIFGIAEGSSGAVTDRLFVVQLDQPAGPGGVSLDYETVELTARSTSDFVSETGSIVIPAGLTQGVIAIGVRQDTTPELSETFAVRIKNVSGATVEDNGSVAIATIYDDDLTPVTGEVFYDYNANGFKDLGEGGIAGVDVEVKWMQGGAEQTTTVSTNASGIYTANVLLGQVSIAVDGTTVGSPYGPIFIFITGEYENTTANETQTVTYEGIVGISPFADVGYKNSFTFGTPSETKGTGRGGTDDTMYGGPGDDEIDAGAGDDFVIGGHWMTATDGNAPINLGTYDADVKVTTAGLHSVHVGSIFWINAAGLSTGGTISGQIWEDVNGTNQQDAGDNLFTAEEVIVNLYDDLGNHVNSLVTTNGLYQFTGLFLKPGGLDSRYVIEFLLPEDWAFVSPGIGTEAFDSDAVNGGRTAVIVVNSGDPTETNVDAGFEPDDAMPSSGSGDFEFDDPVYTVSENDGYVEVVVVRGNSFQGRSVIVRTLEGIGPGFAQEGVNYEKVSKILYFDVGETVKVVRIPIIDTNAIGFTETLTFFVELRSPTGRPLNSATIYIYGDGAGTITDDDDIDGNKDWDIIIGDSGYIPPTVDVENSASWNTIFSAGGPGKDIINAGDGTDFLDSQLGNDIVAGNEGLDEVRAGMGDDVILAELDIDNINGGHGKDTVISLRDVPVIELTSTGLTTAILLHKKADGDTLSTFNLANIEVAKLFGGYRSNVFDIENWDGSAFISGAGGTDTLFFQNDAAQVILKDSTILESLFFLIFHGFLKNSSISLPDDLTYHLGGLEKVVLTGSAGANTFDASGYSRSVTMIGLGGNDILIGGSGNDFFEFDPAIPLGTDTVTGGGGQDTLDFSKSVTPINANLATLDPTAQAVNPNLSLRLKDKIERAIGGSNNDTLTGNDLDNVLIGGPGNDSLIGGAGSETYVFDLDSAFGSETITENIADAGTDTLDFSGTTTRSINVNLALLGLPQVVNSNLTLTIVGEGLEVVLGGALNDIIRGNSNANTLRGGAGADILDGNSGNDFLDGGAGNDELDGGAGIDRIKETANTNFTLNDSSLTRSNGEVDLLESIEHAELAGGSSANLFTLTGWSGTGRVEGGGNFDTIVAAADLDLTLADTSLMIGASVIQLQSVEAAVLSGGPAGNLIDASSFTGSTVINGGDGDDILIGGAGPDVIRGGLGNDSLTGGEDNDVLDGGDGTDALGEARNAFQFILGNNSLVTDLTIAPGDEEFDLLASIEEADLTGGAGINIFDLSDWTAGPVAVHGLAGADAIKARVAGSVQLTASGLIINGQPDVVTFDTLEAGFLTGSDGDDDLDASGFNGLVILEGGLGDDRLVASRGFGQLRGGDGDDRFVFLQDGVAGNVTVDGGTGQDTLDFSAFTSGISVTLGTVGALQVVLAGDLSINLLSEDIEALIGGAGADTLVGNSLANEMTGLGGGDIIAGAGGIDQIIETSDANMTLTNVLLTIGGVNDTLASIESAALTGGASSNTINTTGFTGRAILNGAGGNDTIIAGAGADTIIGGEGNDTVSGGAGNDSYLFDADSPLGNDTLIELPGVANGTDLIDFSSTLSGAVSIDLSRTTLQAVHPNLNLTLSNGDSIENLQGTEFDDSLIGNSLDNIILGRFGVDAINGQGGADTVAEIRDADFILTDTTLTIGAESNTLTSIERALLVGGAGHNVIDASAFTGSVTLSGLDGDDTLIGGRGADTILGGLGRDQLFGNAGNDTLQGGEGDDELSGGGAIPSLVITDNDSLRGGAGNDTYIFDISQETGTDTVIEFAGEGFNDVLVGAGQSGVDIDLFAAGAQTMDLADPTPDSFVILQNAGQVENSFD